MPVPLIIDTDAGDDVDDVLAIAFAARHPNLDLRLVTTVTHASERRARLVRKLLQAAGRTEVPVAAGRARPLMPVDDAWLEGASQPAKTNHCEWVAPEEASTFSRTPEPDGVEELIGAIAASPGEVTVVCIGPLTNIAIALSRQPDLAPKIKRLAIMGGEIAIRHIEHNIKMDAAAAETVFRSGVPILLGTWSVTRGFILDEADCRRIAEKDDPLARGLTECIRLWWPHKGRKPGPVMYDVAPIIWALQPELYQTECCGLRIDPDGRTSRNAGSPECDVTVSMDADRVRDLYWRTVFGGESGLSI